MSIYDPEKHDKFLDFNTWFDSQPDARKDFFKSASNGQDPKIVAKKMALRESANSRLGIDPVYMARMQNSPNYNVDEEYGRLSQYIANDVHMKELSHHYRKESGFIDTLQTFGEVGGKTLLDLGSLAAGSAEFFFKAQVNPEEAVDIAAIDKRQEIFKEKYKKVIEESSGVSPAFKESVLGIGVNALAHTASLIGVTMVNPTAGFLAAFATSESEYYETYKSELGKAEEELTDLERSKGKEFAAYYAAGASLLEYAPVLTWARKMGLNKAFKVGNIPPRPQVWGKTLKEAGVGFIKEGGTEVAQGAYRNLLIDMGLDREINLFTPERLKENLLEFLIGGVIGGGIQGGIGYFHTSASRKRYLKDFAAKKTYLQSLDGQPLTMQEIQNIGLTEDMVDDTFYDDADKESIKAILKNDDKSKDALKAYNDKLWATVEATNENVIYSNPDTSERLVEYKGNEYYFNSKGEGKILKDDDVSKKIKDLVEKKISDDRLKKQREIFDLAAEFDIQRFDLEAKGKRQKKVSIKGNSIKIGKLEKTFETEEQAIAYGEKYKDTLSNLKGVLSNLNKNAINNPQAKKHLDKFLRKYDTKSNIEMTVLGDGQYEVKSKDRILNVTGDLETVQQAKLEYEEERIKESAVDRMIEYIRSTNKGLKVEREGFATLQDSIDQGMSMEEAIAHMKAHGISPDADPATIQVLGSYSAKMKDTIGVYRGLKDPLTVIEEKTHHFVGLQVEAYGIDVYKQLDKWRIQYETAAGRELENVDIESSDGKVYLDEWFARKAKIYTAGKSIDPTVNKNNPFKRFFLELKKYISNILEMAIEMHDLRSSGLVDKQLFEFLDAAMTSNTIQYMVRNPKVSSVVEARNRGFTSQSEYESIFGATPKDEVEIAESKKSELQKQYEDLFRDYRPFLGEDISVLPRTQEDYDKIFHAYTPEQMAEINAGAQEIIDSIEAKIQPYRELFKDYIPFLGENVSVLPRTQEDYNKIFDAVEENIIRDYERLFDEAEASLGDSDIDNIIRADQYLKDQEKRLNSLDDGSRFSLKTQFDSTQEDLDFYQWVNDNMPDGFEKDIEDLSYSTLDERAVKKSDNMLSKVFSTIGRGASYVFQSSIDNIRKISPELARKLKDEYVDAKEFYSRKMHVRAEPFINYVKNLNINERHRITMLLNNGRFDEAIVFAGDNAQAVRDAIEVIKSIQTDVQSVRDIGVVENYFPRIMKDFDGFLQRIGEEPRRKIDQAIRNAREKANRELTPEEKDKIANQVLSGTVRKGGARYTKSRKIDQIDDNIIEFYEDAHIALQKHIESASKDIHKRKLLGKHAVNDDGTIDSVRLQESLGGMLRASNFDAKTEGILIRNISAIMDTQPSHEVTRVARGLTYIGTMMQVSSVVTQFGEAMLAVHSGGLKGLGYYAQAVKRNVFTLQEEGKEAPGGDYIKLQDLNVNGLVHDMISNHPIDKLVNRGFSLLRLKQFGAAGMEAVTNAGVARIRERAAANTLTAKDKHFLKENFGEKNLDSVISELAKSGNNETSLSLASAVLMKYYPVNEATMPLAYLENPNMRIFYTLKTFTVKMFNAIKVSGEYNMQRGFKAIEDGNTMEGMKYITQAIMDMGGLVAALVAGGMATDMIKDMINFGAEPEDFDDLLIDNLYKVGGISRYNLYSFRHDGFSVGAGRLILPALPYIEYPIRDIDKYLVKSEEMESMFSAKSFNILPFAGRMLHGRSEAKKEQMEKLKTKKLRKDLGLD